MRKHYPRTLLTLIATASLTWSIPSLTAQDPTPFEQEYFDNASKPGAAVFNPPEGWHAAVKEALPPIVQIMVIGKGDSTFPPSLNLGVDPFKGTLKEYLANMKAINDAQNIEWKELGTITTQAGQASLSQVDMKSEWGELRMMHAVILKEGNAYVLTAAALKEEFPKFYKDFFTSMRSLRFNPNEKESDKR